jgi:hypothetical protein
LGERPLADEQAVGCLDRRHASADLVAQPQRRHQVALRIAREEIAMFVRDVERPGDADALLPPPQDIDRHTQQADQILRVVDWHGRTLHQIWRIRPGPIVGHAGKTAPKVASVACVAAPRAHSLPLAFLPFSGVVCPSLHGQVAGERRPYLPIREAGDVGKHNTSDQLVQYCMAAGTIQFM